ncbi:MAG: hypothetical protein A3J66_01805 [Candidatus Magasanikbacteria bacterium RIFCSPHIGHO2_02_FULL_47_14]|uniref:Glycosyltransferase subfamily 4-like N-terminal domain-containing protein n=1 Tax=Candidatus Magasanikbacteria bacterium RIFCSPHIGHO2_02_FULL_47_14 TaxID=1798680 RepID=A0A1F6M2Z9_9BACT|nr:MAG: hypothetical protein A3J66_01805 [Candidatus Magasanikbacteria bacterium RIFCSPHIGHO2_02_FULL_47_14]
MNKILLVITKADIGGAQVSTMSLARELVNKGWSVCVGYGQDGSFLEEKMAVSHIDHYRFRSLRRGVNIIKSLSFIREIRQFVKKDQPDIVHFNSSNALVGAVGVHLARTDTKVVFTHRGLSLLDPTAHEQVWKRRVYIFLFRFLTKFVDQQIFVSEANKHEAEKMGLAQRSRVIYNGLNPEDTHFLPNKKAREFFLSRTGHAPGSQTTLLGSVGRLAYQKNFEFVIPHIAALTQDIPDILYFVIGDGPDKKKLQTLIKKYRAEKHIFLLGAVADAHRFLRGLDIVLLPSRYEGMSITLLESLFAGIPAIASDVGGNKEVLGDTGILYPLHDADAFQTSVRELISKKEKRILLSEMARSRARLFTIESTARQYAACYRELLDS